MADLSGLLGGDILPGTPASAQPSDTPAWASATQGAASDANASSGLNPTVADPNKPFPMAPEKDGTFQATMNGHLVNFGTTQPTVADVHHADLITANALAPDANSAEQLGHTFMSALKRGGAAIERWGSDVAGGLNRATGGDADKADQLEANAKQNEQDIDLANASTAKPYGKDDGLFDFANTTADKLGGMAPTLAGLLAAGPAGAITMNAAQSGGEAANASNDNPGATALGTAEGGAVAAMPVPFLKPGGAVLKALADTDAPIAAKLAAFANKPGYIPGVLRSSLGGAVTGPAAAAGNDVVNNYIQGKPLGQIDPNDLKAGLLEGAGFGAGFGATAGVLHNGEPEPNRDIKVDVTAHSNEQPADGGMTPQQRADSAVQDRYAAKANTSYPSASKAGDLNDSVHTDVAQELHDVASTIKPAISPSGATSIDDTLERAGVNATLRTGQNKLKGDVSDGQIDNLLNLKTNANPNDPNETLGQTKQGAQLADLLRQSNTVSQLSRGSQLGGLAALTSKIDPLSGLLPGGNRSLGGIVGELGAKVGIPAAIAPHVSLPVIGGLTAADAAARAVGKVGQWTGLFPGNSKLGNFMQRNAGATPPINFDGLRDIQADNYQAQMFQGRMADATQAQAAQAQAQKNQQTQALADQAAQDAAQAAQNKAGVTSFKNWAKYGTSQLPQEEPPQAPPNAAQQLANYFKYGAGQDARGLPAPPPEPTPEPAPPDRTQEFKNAVKYGGLADLPQKEAPPVEPDRFKSWAQYSGVRGFKAPSNLGTWSQFSGVRGFRPPQAQGPTSMLAPKVAAAPQSAAPAINQAEQAERQAMRENNDPGHPDSFDGRVHARTGMKPQEALAAVQKLADDGIIPQAHADAFRDNPRALMAGNVGNRIVDRLANMQGKAPVASAEPAMNSLRKIAYDAQANGNQARATEADAHILGRSDLSDKTKGAIRTAIHGISATTNKMSAAALRDHLVAGLNGHDQEVADSVVSPLVEQIRHDTPEQSAAHAFKSAPVQQTIKKAADKMTHNNDTSDLDEEAAAMYKGFMDKARMARMSASDAKLYAIQMVDQWVKAGRPGSASSWVDAGHGG